MKFDLRILFVCLVLFGLQSNVTFGEVCKKTTLETVQSFWGEFQDLIERKTLTHPLEQLQSGDVLIFPFGEADEAPPTYRRAIEQKHAALVYSVPTPQGEKLMRLDSPQPPPFARNEFQGEEPYFVLRPKNAGRDYRQKLNQVAAAINDLGFSYDALMQPDYADPKKLEAMRATCETGKGELPSMSCAELVATASTLSGYTVPKGLTLGEILDKGVAELVGTDPAQLPARAGDAAREILDMFRQRPRAQTKIFARLAREAKGEQEQVTMDRDLLLGYLKEPTRPPPMAVVSVLQADLKNMTLAVNDTGEFAPPEPIRKVLKKDIALLEAYLGREVAGPPPADEQEAMTRVAEALNRRVGRTADDQQFFRQRVKKAQEELKQFDMAEIVLRQMVLSRVSGKPLDPQIVANDLAAAKDEDGKPRFGLIERLAARALLAGEGDLMGRRMIRPADFLREQQASGYELVYFYPGNLPELCPMPGPPGPGEEPGPGPENHEP